MQPTTDQIGALVRLWKLAQGNHSTARIALNIIAGCYNGHRFKFDLTDLRLLDTEPLTDAISVLVMDSRPYREVHELLNLALGRRDIGPQLELLCMEWRLKGCCKKSETGYLRERIEYLQGAPA